MFTSTFFRTFVICLFSITFTSAIDAQTEPRDLGFQLYQEENYQEAVKHFQEALIKDMDDRISWNYLAMAYLNLKNYEDADKAFKSISGRADRYEQWITKSLKIRNIPRAPSPLNLDINQGSARVLVEFRKDGTIGMVRLLSTNVPSWKDDVERAAKKIKFQPAERNGKPITVINHVEYYYRPF